VGPFQRDQQSRSVQASHQGRRRQCLLKGCGQSFHPPHPLSRYCSQQCSEAARRWRQRTANQRYRSSERGKERRREQARRYRVVLRSRKAVSGSPREGCEGYPYGDLRGNSCCRRPGCYERFQLTRRSPRQKFCSWLCRQALRRVLIRERRWRRWLARGAVMGRQRDEFG
jgi:hypothetical protein